MRSRFTDRQIVQQSANSYFIFSTRCNTSRTLSLKLPRDRRAVCSCSFQLQRSHYTTRREIGRERIGWKGERILRCCLSRYSISRSAILRLRERSHRLSRIKGALFFKFRWIEPNEIPRTHIKVNLCAQICVRAIVLYKKYINYQ